LLKTVFIIIIIIMIIIIIIIMIIIIIIIIMARPVPTEYDGITIETDEYGNDILPDDQYKSNVLNWLDK